MAEANSGASETGDALAPIIVKKITIEQGGHHGGAWKVAYADFVTAMMAFFLLLWLLGSTTEDQRKGLADYFTPTLVKMKEQSAGADGLLGGSSITDVDSYPNRMGQTGTQSITIPREASGGPLEGGAAEREKRAREFETRLAQRLKENARLRQLARQVRIVRTPEGVRIDLVDDAEFSMFAMGTTILSDPARELVQALADSLGETSAPIIVRGHTDAVPWRPGRETNNWSLSTGRAEATRQALMRGGVSETRFSRIEGVADTEPLIEGNPYDPRNRRISVLLLDR